MSARLIIVSNRVVVPAEADSSLADEMAATVKAALKNQTGVWFGWSGKVTDQRASEPRTIEVNKVTYAQIDLSNNDIQEYCNGLANSVLWPVLHYRVDLQQYSRADASGYLRVNHLYADHLSALMNEDDVVWVHDYHLMALARELRSRGHRNRIGFFLHTPCAPPDILQTLPNHWEILGGLAYCDLVGFQTKNDRDNFADYLVRQGATPTRGGYEIDGRWVRLGAFVGLFEGHSGTDQGLRAIPGDESGLAWQSDAVAAHAEELVRYHATRRDRVRGGRPDRQG
jgi:trehalose 6-phosphate synthase